LERIKDGHEIKDIQSFKGEVEHETLGGKKKGFFRNWENYSLEHALDKFERRKRKKSKKKTWTRSASQ